MSESDPKQALESVSRVYKHRFRLAFSKCLLLVVGVAFVVVAAVAAASAVVVAVVVDHLSNSGPRPHPRRI